MKFIKKLIISNFQSHKYSELDFSQDLNVIVGPSDSGKTAIIRALKWVLYNEPSGDFFLREGENEVSVSVIFSDNTSLKRYRTRSKNGYQLINSDGVESIFEGIGTSVPQEIIDKTGIAKMLLDGDYSNAINLGEQLEGPFLLSEKNSTRANAIGRLVGVDLIDDALREVLKDLRNLNLSKNAKEEAVIELEANIKEYDYIDELKVRRNNLMNLLKSLKICESKKNLLEDKKIQYEKIVDELSKTNEIISKFIQVEEVSNLYISLKDNIATYKNYNSLKLKTTSIKSAKEGNTLILSNLINLESIDDKVPKLDSMHKTYKGLNTFNKNLKSIGEYKRKLEIDIQSSKYLDLADISLKDTNKKINDYISLSNNRKELLLRQESLKKGNTYINNLIPFLEKEDSLFLCKEKVRLLTRLIEKSNKLQSINKAKIDAILTLDNSNLALNTHLDEYSNMLNEVGICPYCLSEIDEKAIKHVIEHHIGG